MWGIVPAAGRGSRIQPLAFSKELLPVGSRVEAGAERPCAVSEHLLERMILGGVDKICMVISPGKYDIVDYYGASYGAASIAYVVQPRSDGLCDAIFRAMPLIGLDEPVLVGLPDTVWFPKAALADLPDEGLAFLLFPVDEPHRFDAVVLDAHDRVIAIDVKTRAARSRWIWGAFRLTGRTLHALHALWLARERRDEYFGGLVNAWIAQGGVARGLRAGARYIDVGTFDGYREAMKMLDETGAPSPRAAALWPAGRPIETIGAPL